MVVDRFIALTWPLKAAMICTMKKAHIATVVVIVISVVFGGVNALRIPRFQKYKYAICPYSFDEEFVVVYTTLVNIQSFYLPIVTLIPLNCGIILAVLKSKKASANLRCTNTVSSKEGAITRTIIIITSAFIIFSLPIRIHTDYWSGWKTEITAHLRLWQKLTLNFGIAVNMSNYALNSYMYVLACERYRKELLVLLVLMTQCVIKQTKRC
jgi:hypothetical protein